jgi:deoxycytidylate deaminase
LTLVGKKLWESVEASLETIQSRAYADAKRVALDAIKHETLTVPVPEWDEYFYVLAQAAALRSKDSSRKVGAVIVSRDNVVLSTGFNGFPRGVKDLRERWTKKQEKLLWVAHAEANAIFNAARTGISVEGGTIYTTTFPCTLCAFTAREK